MICQICIWEESHTDCRVICSSFFIQPKWLTLHRDTHLTLSNAGCLAICSVPHRATQATTVSRKADGNVNEILNLDCNLPVCDTVHSGRWISAFGRVSVRLDVARFYVSLVYLTMLPIVVTIQCQMIAWIWNFGTLPLCGRRLLWTNLC